MKKFAGCRSRLMNQAGATAVLIAMLGTVLAGFTALAIDIGYLMLTRNELQNVADASALAACRKLGVIYQDLDYGEQQSYVCDPATIIPVAQEVGLKNKAATKWIQINTADVEIGRWSAGTFSATLNKPNAVRVRARRDSSANGPIPTFFAGVLGINLMQNSAVATAALGGQSTTPPGGVKLPVGISRAWFEDEDRGDPCGDHIVFSPTTDPDACAGWTTFTEGANTANLRDILDGELASDSTVAGVTLWNFTGGDLAAAFSNMLSLFQREGSDVDLNGDWLYDASGNKVNLAADPVTTPTLYFDANGNQVARARALYELDGAGNETTTRLYYTQDNPHDPLIPRNHHAWETSVPVYENVDGTADCSNPNQEKRIVGYARIRLTDVVDAPARKIVGELVCGHTDNEATRGGGGTMFGLMGSIPGLVQ